MDNVNRRRRIVFLLQDDDGLIIRQEVLARTVVEGWDALSDEQRQMRFISLLSKWEDANDVG